ncbi:DNA polymerase zeta subunit 2 [Zeugodacus cucurbitae]|uniref:DNA polymerase zeta subunit 2 n=1 Tax=Zeugodacus cucurbitae TaxID=28588 RepID=UPI0023D92780|nr:DNA polymerase zeta subunit 2 [Zeugodacus cucurbitae]
MSKEELADILIEALEVFLNHILYVRDLYPAQIFKKRRFYNAPVYVSIFPPLNAYIHNVLRTARELQQRGELQCVVLQFYHDEIHLNECYSIDIQQLETTADGEMMCDDKLLIDFEEQLRCSLYKLAERLKPLDKLPKVAKFKITLNTTQEAFIHLSHNSNYQDFPWLCDGIKPERSKRDIALLPLTHLNNIGLKVNLEIF